MSKRMRVLNFVGAVVALVVGALMFGAAPVAAHGTAINWTIENTTVTLEALYDTGDPMSNASITVFAPSEPEDAFITGTADADGVFSFDLDGTDTGVWGVTVRGDDGHGEFVNIPFEGAGLTSSGTTAIGKIQQTAIMIAIVAGLVGFAFYTNAKNKKENI